MHSPWVIRVDSCWYPALHHTKSLFDTKPASDRHFFMNLLNGNREKLISYYCVALFWAVFKEANDPAPVSAEFRTPLLGHWCSRIGQLGVDFETANSIFFWLWPARCSPDATVDNQSHWLDLDASSAWFKVTASVTADSKVIAVQSSRDFLGSLLVWLHVSHKKSWCKSSLAVEHLTTDNEVVVSH